MRPVLAANCYDCHTEDSLGGLRLDSREAMLKGGKSGPAIVPGDPDKSLLISGGAANERQAEDAERRTSEAGRSRRARRVGARGSHLACRRGGRAGASRHRKSHRRTRTSSSRSSGHSGRSSRCDSRRFPP